MKVLARREAELTDAQLGQVMQDTLRGTFPLVIALKAGKVQTATPMPDVTVKVLGGGFVVEVPDDEKAAAREAEIRAECDAHQAEAHAIEVEEKAGYVAEREMRPLRVVKP